MGVITQEMNRKKQLETVAEGLVKFIKLDKFQEPKVTLGRERRLNQLIVHLFCLRKMASLFGFH